MSNRKVEQNTSKQSKKLALHYMKILADVAREPFLILDNKLRVISANPMFYKVFLVSPKETENKFFYNLGNKQWDITELRNLLVRILPKRKVVKNYEVKHAFEKIGKKTMLLNARQIDSVQLIILAIEDITNRKILEEKLANHARDLTIEVEKNTKELADKIQELESINKSMVGRELKMVELKKEIQNLKKRVKNGNGKNGNWRNGNGNHKK